MTKVEAIVKVIESTEAKVATWTLIYCEIEKYYPGAKANTEIGKAGLRGVLYRELRKGRTFEQVGPSAYALHRNCKHEWVGQMNGDYADTDACVKCDLVRVNA
jgi:hypothetical protein